MKKKLLCVLLMAVLVFAVTACSNSDGGGGTEAPAGGGAPATEGDAPAAAGDIVIGFVGMTLNNEFHITLANAAVEKGVELGIQVDTQAGQQHASSEAQLTIIENMLANNVNGFVIVPSSSEGLESSLVKIREANIPIVNADTQLNVDVVKNAGYTDGIPFYGTDNFAGAKLAGEFVRDNFEQGVETFIVTGIEGHKNTSDRLEGFKEGAGDWVVVVATQTANWEVDQGYQATLSAIEANPNLGLIFASNDNMGIGALRAVQERNKSDQIKVIGYDAVSEALNLVKSGEFLATVAQDPAQMGVVSVDNVYKMIKGEPYETYVDTGCKLITQANVDEQIAYVAQFVD